MKIMCLFIPLSVLIAGCYSEGPLTKGALAPDGQNANFVLKDGSRIESQGNDHHRAAGGYQVSGKWILAGGDEKEFSGMLFDQDINRIELREFHAPNVVALLLSVGSFVALVVAIQGSWVY